MTEKHVQLGRVADVEMHLVEDAAVAGERRAPARSAIKDHGLVLGKILVVVGRFGSARNSSMPRETCTAPATLPLFSTSGASRTSTTSVLPFGSSRAPEPV